MKEKKSRRQRAREAALGLLRERGVAVPLWIKRRDLVAVLRRVGLAPDRDQTLANWFSWWILKKKAARRKIAGLSP